jgi:hypothetical protein
VAVHTCKRYQSNKTIKTVFPLWWQICNWPPEQLIGSQEVQSQVWVELWWNIWVDKMFNVYGQSHRHHTPHLSYHIFKMKSYTLSDILLHSHCYMYIMVNPYKCTTYWYLSVLNFAVLCTAEFEVQIMALIVIIAMKYVLHHSPCALYYDLFINLSEFSIIC